MVLTLDFQQKDLHKSKWYLGYDYNCDQVFKKNHIGPKNGTLIKINKLPIKLGKNNYLRFWAAKPNPSGQLWKNPEKAYNEDTKLESEPNLNYFNGGLVKIDNRGTTKFKIILPSGYYDSKNKPVKAHIHYRICVDGKMSGVYTQDIDNNPKESPIAAIKNPKYLNRIYNN